MPCIAPGDLRVRRAEPADYAGFAATLATPRAIAGTLQLPLPSLEVWRERLAKADPASFLIVAEARPSPSESDDFEIVGHLSLFPTGHGPSPRRSHAVGLGMSVRDAWQGRGVGTALLSTALERADRWMNVLRVELTVFADNDVAIALYRRHGFVVEGTHRAYALRDGVYVDALSMARLHPHPPVFPGPTTEHP